MKYRMIGCKKMREEIYPMKRLPRVVSLLLVLMFLLLVTGILKLPQVKETAEFLIEIMTIMFIPATVGLMENWDVLQPILLPLIVIIPVTTVLVMGVTGRTAQRIRRRGEKEK